MIRLLLSLLFCPVIASGSEPVPIRVVAANLTSDNRQTYSPDNGNHSNPEGAGARILKALKPDIVLIQEFNTSIPPRQWVNGAFGKEFHFAKEDTKGIPNGVISRFPIAASGIWDDPVLNNREFFWARLRIPEQRDLWAVSLHLHSKSPASRLKQTEALLKVIHERVPKDDLILLGGDFNTRSTGEPCFKEMVRRFVVPAEPPHDGAGNIFTNKPRNRPYDWVLASPAMDRHEVPVELAGKKFEGGLVFDTRVFEPLDQVPPVQEGDSGLPQMQHMAVVRDFLIPQN